VLIGFVLGGMSAGLAAAMILLGSSPNHALFRGHGNLTGIGFDGMAVAMVGRNHPIGILFSAMFFGGMTAGGRLMQLGAGSSRVPVEMVRLVMGVIVVTMSIPELVRIAPTLKKQVVSFVESLRQIGKRAKKGESA
jgi:simple sugar transport system permease protein